MKTLSSSLASASHTEFPVWEARVGPLGPGKPRRFMLTKPVANISSLISQMGTLRLRDRACPIQVHAASPYSHLAGSFQKPQTLLEGGQLS